MGYVGCSVAIEGEPEGGAREPNRPSMWQLAPSAPDPRPGWIALAGVSSPVP